MSFHSSMKWWRSPLPPSLLTKRSNRFALATGAGLAFAGVTMTTLNAIGGGLGYAQKFELSEQSCLTRKKMADKLGLPSPQLRQDLNRNYPSAASVYYARTNAGDNLLSCGATSLLLGAGSAGLFKFTPIPYTPRQFFWFRGPAVVLGACAATVLAIIPLSVYPTYAQLDAHWKAKVT